MPPHHRWGSTGSGGCPGRSHHRHTLHTRRDKTFEGLHHHVETWVSKQERMAILAAAPLGWKMLDTNFTTGALLGYSSENSRVSLKVPACGALLAQMLSTELALLQEHSCLSPPSHGVSSGPKMIAFHSMMLSGLGEPSMPWGGSFCSLLKSRMRRCTQQNQRSSP